MTIAVQLTEDEIKQLIIWHGYSLNNNQPVISDTISERIERLNYLNKRIKAFKEPKLTETSNTQLTVDAETIAISKGWG